MSFCCERIQWLLPSSVQCHIRRNLISLGLTIKCATLTCGLSMLCGEWYGIYAVLSGEGYDKHSGIQAKAGAECGMYPENGIVEAIGETGYDGS
jgi:hypothetical protein